MQELTQEDQGAIYLERARGNAAKLTYRKRALIALIGSNFHITTESGHYRLKKFFGHLYYIYFK